MAKNLNKLLLHILNIAGIMPSFDIEREDLYEYNKPKERTRKRLIEMA